MSIGSAAWLWNRRLLSAVLLFLLVQSQSVESSLEKRELKLENQSQPQENNQQPQISQNDTICDSCQCRKDSKFITVICDFNQNKVT